MEHTKQRSPILPTPLQSARNSITKLPSVSTTLLPWWRTVSASLADKAVAACLTGYVELLAHTGTVELCGDFDQLQNTVVGFWHTDSFGMNVLLHQLQHENLPLTVVATASRRGNVIQRVMQRYGANSLRLPDGLQMKRVLREVKQACKTDIVNLAIALDGPLGPLKEPKKLGFLLAHHAQKNAMVVTVSYSHHLALRKRWDKYAIPLPFTRIRFTAHNLGPVEKAQLQNFDTLKHKIQQLSLAPPALCYTMDRNTEGKERVYECL